MLSVFAAALSCGAFSPASALESRWILESRDASFEGLWRPMRLGVAPLVVPPQPPPAPVPSPPTKVAKIKGNPGAWVTGKDYPPAAFKKQEQGIARFVLSIDASGKPSGCIIVGSTGSNDLDVATCSLVMRRAEFLPARDAFERAIPGSYSGAVRWVLPVQGIRQADLAVPLRVAKYDAELGAGGQIIGCRVEFISGDRSTVVIFAGQAICEERFKPH